MRSISPTLCKAGEHPQGTQETLWMPAFLNRSTWSWLPRIGTKWQRLPSMLCTQADLMTDNGRPKREAIAARYAQLIESLYPQQITENP